jgi:DNA-binding SARP family transcriptional activator/ABC-type glycerol-3-phosphate transport system substrate-binding protein/tRNA A-37 threonylcarbamoyl transferase component Bud32
MEFRVLGRLEGERDGASVSFGSYRQRSLLALLLIHANHVVSTDRIIDELWGEEVGGERHNALWVHVSNLRSALEPSRERRSDGTLVLTRAPGYVLQLRAEQLDVWRFERLLEEGRALLDTDPSAASLAIGEGLALWRGQPYEDFVYERFAESEVSRLEELRFEAVELRVEADLRQGLAAELVGELEGLAHLHPLREHLTSLLMVALYRCGRRADALRAYGRLRARLGGELGLEPSAPLRALEAQILAGDPALDHTGSVSSQSRLAVRGYELRDEIGGGIIGRSFRAYQPVIGREVAVKVIRPELADDAVFIRRFEADAERVARLDHPHIVPLYDYWREPGAAYIVTRLFRGGSLDDTLGRGPLDTTAAAGLIDAVGSALAFAHHHGVVHGDVKPGNILFDDARRAYLGDFGIGAGDEPAEEGSWCTAPEVRAGGQATAMSDVYSLGAVLALALTGISLGDLPAAIAALPAPVGSVIGRATAADASARYRDAAAFADALRHALYAAPGDRAPIELENPYKGLSAFGEADAEDFFGRARQVERLLARLGETGTRGRFVAVVGPSGSGKSSVVSAGVLPALRDGALPGSAEWFVVTMTPGSHPFEELEAALRRIAVNPPAGLLDQLMSGPAGIRRAVRRVLPDDHSPLLVVIDQFEELFTQTAEGTAVVFLDALAAAVEDLQSHLRVLVTLRADFYDRPLGHRRIGELLRIGTEVITPMSPEELEQAIDGPAARLEVRFEPRLVAEIVADVADRSGALPLLQYALTELFDRRHGQVIEFSAYRAMGRVSGALVRRAEELYAGLDPDAQAMTRQMMLRLVSLGDDTEVTRRRVLRQELSALDGSAVDAVLDTFGRHRLLSFDRDPITRGPTVEIAHEALLSAWGRLRDWIDDSRDEVRQQRRLAAAAAEWQASGEEPGYLLHGPQLDELAAWAAATDLSLHPSEQALLHASVMRREHERSAEQHRQAEERRLRRKTRRRTRQLIASAVVLALVAGLAAFAVVKRSEANALSAKLAANLAANGESRRLAAASTSMAGGSPELALLLALQALDVSRRHGQPALREAQDALHWAIQGDRLTYPGRDAPVAVRIGPTGPTGTFDLPLPQLVDLARHHVSRTFTSAECDNFHIRPCPLDGASLASPAAAGPRDVPAAAAPPPPVVTATPLAGTTVNIVGVCCNAGLAEELANVEAETGIHISYRQAVSIDTEVQDSDPPDVIFANPGLITHDGRAGELVRLDGYLDTAAVHHAYGDYVTNAVSVGGTLYGLPLDLNTKGIVWYPKPEFDAAGYAVPKTWDQLIALTKKMVADGKQPWCVGFASGQSSGWPGTDWVEALLLRVAGAGVYDQWAAHTLPFDAAPVRQAMQMLGDIVFPDSSVRGGAQSISQQHFLDAAKPMFTNPPGCWLYHQASFLLDGELPPGVQAGLDVGFFVLPGLTADGPAPLFGGGDFAAAFKDRPEVREVMRRILDPSWGARSAASADGVFLPANTAFDPEQCRPSGVAAVTGDLRVQLCRVNRDAVASGQWRFDASDMMPVGIGSPTKDGTPAAFWQGMLDYVDQGPGSADAILRAIDADPHWASITDAATADRGPASG